MERDDWQLEMLCNIAAAEIVMPAGQFESLKTENLDINHLMDLRRTFDVSTEALFLRVIRLTEQNCVMFAASRISEKLNSDYQIDYSLEARNASVVIPQRFKLHARGAIAECTAIGFTAKSYEKWAGVGDVNVQCVGIPPYPGHQLPRVIGLICPADSAPSNTTKIVELKGDALSPRGNGPQIVTHIVNDKTGNWGGGFARVVARALPEVQDDFREWAGHRSNLKLGNVRFAKANNGIEVASMVAQHGYGDAESPRIRYHALATCLDQLSIQAVATGASVHMPRIGTGNAGGDWRIISNLIDEIVCSNE